MWTCRVNPYPYEAIYFALTKERLVLFSRIFLIFKLLKRREFILLFCYNSGNLSNTMKIKLPLVIILVLLYLIHLVLKKVLTLIQQ